MVSVKKIKEFARHIGLDDLRITTARPFNTAYNRIKKQLKEDIFLPGERWRNYDLAKFCDAHSQLNHARTIICSCLSYLTTGKEDLSEPRNPHGLIARYTWGNHYL